MIKSLIIFLILVIQVLIIADLMYVKEFIESKFTRIERLVCTRHVQYLDTYVRCVDGTLIDVPMGVK